MKVLMIIAVSFALMILIDCRYLHSSRNIQHKKSTIVDSRKAGKRQYYSDTKTCCGQYGYPEPYSCCPLSNSPPCCETVHQPQQTMVPTNTNCCQAPNSPLCCSGVPEQISLQGCCSSAQTIPTVNTPEPCRIKLGKNGNLQQNITLTNSATGQKFQLNVKLVPAENQTVGTSETTGNKKPLPTEQATRPTTTPTESVEEICQEEALSEHNAKREIHNSPAMILDNEMNKMTESIAKALMNKKQNNRSFEEKRGESWGWNLFEISGLKPDHDLDCKTVVDKWYKEVEKYNFDTPGYSDKTKHFSQLVWKGSTKLGIGLASAIDKSKPDGKSYVVVAAYTKRGNIDGQFEENVEKGNYGSSSVMAGFEHCRQQGLIEHNIKRKIHYSQPMALDPDLNEKAQNLANEFSQIWKPTGEKPYVLSHLRGSANIVMIKRSFLEADSTIGLCKTAVNIWYDEVDKYDFTDPEYSEPTTHFTQLVWKSNRKLGMGKAMLSDRSGYVVVAMYQKGNKESEFTSNVQQGQFIKYTDTQKAALLYQNEKRSLHRAGSLLLDKNLTEKAGLLAKSVALKKMLRLEPVGSKPGQNTYIKCSANNIDNKELARAAVEDWYRESENYNFSDPKFHPSSMHFTQMIWKGSTKLGIGTANFTTYERGVTYKLWNNIKQGSIKALQNDNRFPINPDKMETLQVMKVNQPNVNYGQTMTAYFVPNKDGMHVFYANCSSYCELDISTDEKAENSRLVIETTKYHPEFWKGHSTPLMMYTGMKYYMRTIKVTKTVQSHLYEIGVKLPGEEKVRLIVRDNLLRYPLTASGTCQAMVAVYDKPGNQPGEFGANVGRARASAIESINPAFQLSNAYNYFKTGFYHYKTKTMERVK